MSESLFCAIGEIIGLLEKDLSVSGDNTNAWIELVRNCETHGTVVMKYTEPVREATCKYLKRISDEEKRRVWRETEVGQEVNLDDDGYIPSIEMDLEEELFSQVIEVAFEESKHEKH